MLAAVAAAVWPWRTADYTARWEAPIAQPGVLARLEVCAPAARGTANARVVLIVSTPREEIRREVGTLRLEEGRGAREIALEYPYERLVPGPYGYRVEVHLDGRVVKSARPIRYQIGAPSCFA